MADDKIVTEQDVDKLIKRSTSKKLTRETKEARHIYRRAIVNIAGILMIGVGIISWPQLSRMLSENFEETILSTQLFCLVFLLEYRYFNQTFIAFGNIARVSNPIRSITFSDYKPGISHLYF